MAGGVGHTGGLTNPRPWHGRCRAGYSNTSGPPLPRKRAPLQKTGLFTGLGGRIFSFVSGVLVDESSSLSKNICKITQKSTVLGR